MKGSAIREGWNSFAAKLHPQVPLSINESYSLVNTLNRSFRAHLDEVHPVRPREDGNSANALVNATGKSNGRASGLTAKGVNVAQQDGRVKRPHYDSSAAQTDLLLSSVLTNPLLAKSSANPFSLESAKRAIAAGTDPIRFFANAHSQGKASPAIAWICLDSFVRDAKSLSPTEMKTMVMKHRPGSAVLRWLHSDSSALYDVFTRHERLKSHIVRLSIMENNTESLWKCLETDVPAGFHLPADELTQHATFHSLPGEPGTRDLRRTTFWKAKLGSHIVMRQLKARNASANSALQAFQRLIAIHNIQVHQQSINRLRDHLVQEFIKNPVGWASTDPNAYDAFVQHVKDVPGDLRGRFQSATLALLHRDKARSDPAPMTAVLEEILKLPSTEMKSLLRTEASVQSNHDALKEEDIWRYLVLAINDLRPKDGSDVSSLHQGSVDELPTLKQDFGGQGLLESVIAFLKSRFENEPARFNGYLPTPT